MFGQFQKAQQAKNILKARSQLKKIQKEMASVTTTVNKGDVEVFVTAENFPAFKVKTIEKDGVEMPDVVEAINQAAKDIQKKAAKRMMESGEGLSGLTKGF